MRLIQASFHFPLMLSFDKATMSWTNLSTNNTCLRPRIYYLWKNKFSWRFHILLFIIKPQLTSTTNFSLEDTPHEEADTKRIRFVFSLSMGHCLTLVRLFSCLLTRVTRQRRRAIWETQQLGYIISHCVYYLRSMRMASAWCFNKFSPRVVLLSNK